MNIIEYQNFGLKFKNNEKYSIKDINFALKDDEILGIIGKSGSGKTISAMALLGLLNNEDIDKQEGKILYKNLDITKLKEEQLRHIRGSEIAAIYQDSLTALNPVYTIGQQLIEAIIIHKKISKKQAKSIVLKMLIKVGLDGENFINKYPNEISGGQRQRVLIAMALLMEPKIIVADEPTTALDVIIQAQILDLLKQIKDEFKISIIIITHDLGVISETCDRVIVMDEGRIVECADTFKIFNNPNSTITKEFLRLLNSKNLQKNNYKKLNKKNILNVSNLNKSFILERSFLGRIKRQFKALDNISFNLEQNDIFAIVGESGSGKSTLAKTIMGLNKKDGGSIKFLNQDIYELKRFEKVKAIQMIFQDPYSSLDPSMKIETILKEGIKEHKKISNEDIDKEIKQLLKLCDLDNETLNKYPKEFSGGQRQRIAIVRALTLDPSIIIADEPMSALDMSTKFKMMDLMMKIRKEKGISYIFISHDFSLVKYIASKIAVMYAGEIVEIFENNDSDIYGGHPYTKMLIDSIPSNHPALRKKTGFFTDINNKTNTFNACKFSNKCKFRKDICDTKNPKLTEIEKGHLIACHYPLIFK